MTPPVFVGAVALWTEMYNRNYRRGVNCPYCLSLSIVKSSVRMTFSKRVGRCLNCCKEWKVSELSDVEDTSVMNWVADKIESAERAGNGNNF